MPELEPQSSAQAEVAAATVPLEEGEVGDDAKVAEEGEVKESKTSGEGVVGDDAMGAEEGEVKGSKTSGEVVAESGQPDGTGEDKWWEKEDTWEPPPKRRRTRKQAEEERGPCVVMLIPSDVAESLKSNDNKKLQELCSANGVEAEFEDEQCYAEEEVLISFEIGDKVEVQKEGEWHLGTVESLLENHLKIKMEKDSSEVEVPKADVRRPLAQEIGDAVKDSWKDAGTESWNVEADALPGNEEAPFKIDDKVEAKFGKDDWRDAKVVSEAGSEESIKIKWEFDGTEEEIVLADVRRPTPASEPVEAIIPDDFLKIGAEVEGKYGESWSKAVVLGIGGTTVRIRWGFDESEERVEKSNVRPIAPEEPPPPLVLVKLIIFGGTPRARMQMELEVMQITDKKVPDFFNDHPREAEELEGGLGWTVVALLNDGELKPKIVGKKGSMKLKITKACGSSMAIVGNNAHIVGTQEQRTCTECILDIIQRTGKGEDVKDIPEPLRHLCRVIRVPDLSMAELLKDSRAVLNSIEESTEILTFLLSAAASVAKDALGKNETATEYTAGMEVEGSVLGKWQKAKVIEQFLDDDDDVMIRIKWESDGKEIDLPPSRVRCCDGRNRFRDLLAKSRPVALLGSTEQARRLAELRMLDVVERTDDKGFAKEVLLGAQPTSSFDGSILSSMDLSTDDVEKCRREPSVLKLQAAGRASRCVIELVGEAVYFMGTDEQRKCGKECVQWWLKGSELEVDERDDVEKLVILKDKVPNLNESVTSKVEEETCTFVLWDDGAALAGIEDSARALICGLDNDGRKAALAKLSTLQDVVPEPTWGETTNTWDDEKKEDDDAEKKDDGKTDGNAWEAKNDDAWSKSGDAWAEGKSSNEEAGKEWGESKKAWDEKEDTKEAGKEWDESKKGWDEKEDKKETGNDWDESKKGWDEKQDTKAWGNGGGTVKMCNDFKNGKCSRAKCKFSHGDAEAGEAESWNESSKKDEGDSAWKADTSEKDDKSWNAKPEDAWNKSADTWAEKKDEGKDWDKSKTEWDEKGDTKAWGADSGEKKMCRDFQMGKCSRTTCKFSHGDGDAEMGDSWADSSKKEEAWDNKKSSWDEAPAKGWADDSKKDEDAKNDWGEAKKDDWGESTKSAWGDKGEQEKKICFDFQKGKCTRATCKFSHGDAESAWDEKGAGDGEGADQKWGNSQSSEKKDEWAKEKGGNDGGWGKTDEVEDKWESSAAGKRDDLEGAPEAKRPRYDVPSIRRPTIPVLPPAPTIEGQKARAPTPISFLAQRGPRPAVIPVPSRGAVIPSRGAVIPSRGAVIPSRGVILPLQRQVPTVAAPRNTPVTYEVEAEEEEDEAVDPLDEEAFRRLEVIGFPASVGEWLQVQQKIWPRSRALPSGWIRVWSRSRGGVYFLRMADQHSTFDIEEAMRG